MDYLMLLDAQRERLNAEDAQALGETDQYRGIVAICKALGGGWDRSGGRVAGRIHAGGRGSIEFLSRLGHCEHLQVA